VAEEADRRLDVGEGLGGVELAEDVVVLVEGRAVADGDGLLDDLGALLQPDQEVEVLPGDRLLGPEDGRRGDGIEGLDGVEPGDRLVVVAPDDGQGLEGQDLLDDLVRRGPVADEVAEKEVVVDPLLLDGLEDRVEGLEVAVDVGEDQVAQGTPSFSRTLS
jgi:hypothetical protein